MDVVISVEEGKLRGKESIGLNGVRFHSFQGIPYAKPPLADLRFKAPRPLEKWEGIKDCTQEGSSCPSRHMIYNNIIGSEDCLFLNVFTKNHPNNSAHKPVMVWIHGGGFLNGSSNLYGPDFFMTKDVVLVTINYRIGILGNLTFDDPDLGVLGNTGFKDQVMALKWVQRNIEHFGGDPGNVTIFGESAGGASVHYLILSPMAKGLFHKAILQSGCALCPWSTASNCLKDVLNVLQCPYTTESDALKFLQEQPIEKILDAQDNIGDHLDLHVRRNFGLVIEKAAKIEPNFMTESPLDVLKKGVYNKVPMILGYTTGEGFFTLCYKKIVKSIKVIITNFEEAIPNNFGDKIDSNQSKIIAEKIKKFYYGSEEPSEKNIEKFILLHGDAFFMFGIHQSVEYHLKSSSEQIYMYRFSVEGQRNLFKTISGSTLPGASHVDELPYLFHMGCPELLNDNKIAPNSLEDKTIKRMISLWTNFAKTGDPNPAEKDDLIPVIWKPITKDAFNYIDIGENLSVGINPDEKRMNFWQEIYNSLN